MPSKPVWTFNKIQWVIDTHAVQQFCLHLKRFEMKNPSFILFNYFLWTQVCKMLITDIFKIIYHVRKTSENKKRLHEKMTDILKSSRIFWGLLNLPPSVEKLKNFCHLLLVQLQIALTLSFKVIQSKMMTTDIKKYALNKEISENT